MIKRLIWTIWTPMSSVPQKADKLNLSLSKNYWILASIGLVLDLWGPKKLSDIGFPGILRVCMEGMAWNVACWYIMTASRNDLANYLALWWVKNGSNLKFPGINWKRFTFNSNLAGVLIIHSEVVCGGILVSLCPSVDLSVPHVVSTL